MTAIQNQWFRCEIDKKLLKQLSKRSDKPAAIWFGAYFTLLTVLGLAVVVTYGTHWAWPAVLAYGLVWGFCVSGVHETCHGTPFRSRFWNEVSLWTFCWMAQMEPVSVRWAHAGHHSYTHFDEGDTELSEPNPVSWRNFFGVGLGVGATLFYWRALLSQALGKQPKDWLAIIPEAEQGRSITNARWMLASYLALIALSLIYATWLPLVLGIFPRLIGGPVTGFMHLTQHTCLRMNVQDHRHSTRSFTAGPILRFFYFNMNHHIEHHMFPMVPFYNLPQLHAAIADQLPPPCEGFIGVYREILPAIFRQHREPGYFIPRDVPQAQVDG